MSDLRMDVCPTGQFTSLIFSNQRCKEPDSKRDFSPEFQAARQDAKREHRSDVSKRSKIIVNALSLNLSSKSDPNQENKLAKQRKVNNPDQDETTKRPDRSARGNKLDQSKALLCGQNSGTSSKQNLFKETKGTALTPKYRQISLKRNGFVCAGDGGKADVKLRDKSTNYPKKGKLWIELSKINSVNKARGASADNVTNDCTNDTK